MSPRADWPDPPCGVQGRCLWRHEGSGCLVSQVWTGECGLCARYCVPSACALCRRVRLVGHGRPKIPCDICARGRSAARPGGPGARTLCTCRWWRRAAGTRAQLSTCSLSTTGQCGPTSPALWSHRHVLEASLSSSLVGPLPPLVCMVFKHPCNPAPYLGRVWLLACPVSYQHPKAGASQCECVG